MRAILAKLWRVVRVIIGDTLRLLSQVPSDMVHTRSIPVNAVFLKQARVHRGWTQAELARRSGYSVRVVRKAESGNSLNLDTITALAEALSQAESIISPKQLMLDQKAIAEKFLHALDTYGPDMVEHIEHYLAEDCVFVCPGDPNVAPFIGQWQGADGLRKFFSIYCSIFQRLPSSDVTIAVAEDVVILRFMENAYLNGQPCDPVRINMHFKFHEGLIVRIEDDYDTQGAADGKRKAEQKLSQRSSSA